MPEIWPSFMALILGVAIPKEKIPVIIPKKHERMLPDENGSPEFRFVIPPAIKILPIKKAYA